MKTRKIFSLVLAAILVFALVPVMSLAEGIDGIVTEAKGIQKLDNVWAVLEKAEAQALQTGTANRYDVISAVYNAALNNADVDKDSFSDFSEDGFFFTVDGMYNAYNYRIRNEVDNTAAPIPDKEKTIVVPGTKNAGSANVLLVAPYYGSDSSFTDQYKNEAQSIANATGGSYTLIQASNATGPAIAAAYPDKGVIIYDSHGAQSGTSSYLCLTSSSGITTTDYNNGWAVKNGSYAWIDGRYIQNHITSSLSNPFVWMAICEGMKKEGRGTTGTALLAAGCGGVYGYSQSVSFTGDYKYEAKFWTEMKNGATVAQAFQAMKDTYGVPDPVSGGDAYPIVMSDVDAFPSNPDSEQTVYCTWTLFGSSDPVAVTGISMSPTSAEVGIGSTAALTLTVNPSDASDYSIAWTTSNSSIATVSGSGKTATVTGVAEGTATITATLTDNVGNKTYSKTATITVVPFTGWIKVDSLTNGGTYIIVASDSSYAVGNTAVTSSHYLNAVAVTVNADNTLTLGSSVNVNAISWTAGSTTSGWTFLNIGNGKYMGLDSSEYLYPSSTALAWAITSEGYLNNQTDSEGYYYLSYDSTNSRYTTSKNGTVINFYQYVSGSEPDPTEAPTAAPTATPTAAPTATPTAAPTATPTAVPTAVPTEAPTEAPDDPTLTGYVPVDTIEVGETYMIGFVVDGEVYVIMNYNPSMSNKYYYSNNSIYYGYTAKATVDSNGVITGVSGWTTNMDYCTWTFSSTTGGRIKSTQGSRYLSVYSSSRYADLYPSTSTSWSNWSYSDHTLSYTTSYTTKYACYKPTVGSYSNFCYAPTSSSSTYGYVQLYKYVDGGTTEDPVEPVTGEYYTPVDTISTSDTYMIGFVVNGEVYVIMNYNPSMSNNYYYSNGYNYYGYTAKAVLDENGNITGVSGWTTDPQYCTWTFSSTTGGRIKSTYNARYLSVYSSSSYSDLYPSTSSSYSNWTYSNHTLSYKVSTSVTKYACYKASAGSYSNFCYAPTTSSTTYGYVQLYKYVGSSASVVEAPAYQVVNHPAIVADSKLVF